MTTPQFPNVLPGVSSLEWSPVPQVGVSDNEVGPKTNRRRTQVPAAVANVTWRFLQEDFSVFQDFYKNALKRGHKWFRLTLPCGAGYAQHVVRFQSHRSAPSNGYEWREVTAILDVRERRLRPNIIYTTITTTPYPTYNFESVITELGISAAQYAKLITPINELEGVDCSALPLAGLIRVALKYGYADDSLDSELSLLSGEIRTALRALAAQPPDETTSTVRPRGGTFWRALITTTIPPDAVDSSATVVSGTLT